MFANWYAELNLFSLATFPPVSAQRNTICNIHIYICIFVSLYCATQRNTVCVAQFDDKIIIILVQFIDYESCRTYEWPHLSTLNTFIDSIHDTRHFKICMSVLYNSKAKSVYMSLFDEKRPPKSFYVSFNVSFIDSIHDTRHFKKICMSVLHNSKAKSQLFSRNSYSVNIHCLCVTECCRVLQRVAECCCVLQCQQLLSDKDLYVSVLQCVEVCCSVLQQSQQPLPDTDLHVCLTTTQENGSLTKKMAFSQKKWHSHKKNGILVKKMAFS